MARRLPAFFVLSFAFLFPLLCNAQEDVVVRIPPHSDIKVAADFDSGKDPNSIGGFPSVSFKKPSFLQSAYSKKEKHGEKGYSLEIEYYVPKGEDAIWSTDLNELDISAAKGVSFWIKCTEGSEKFWLALEDKAGNRNEVNLAGSIKPVTDWQEIKVPVGKFPSIDTNKMGKFSLDFKGEPSVISGKIYLDDISFYGDPELFFLGLKDNTAYYPEKVLANERKRDLLTSSDNQMLMGIAQDTWGFFKNVVDKRSHLPLDWIGMAPERAMGDYTSPTNTGLYFINIVAAFDLKFITREEAVKRISDTLDVMEKMPRWRGLWDNYHSTTNLQVTRRYISSVDNGWFAGGLIIARQAFDKELGKRCSKLLDEMDFSALYNKELGQLNLGYDGDTEKYSPYNYGQLNGEARFTSLVAIGKGNVPQEHWYKMARTFPPEIDWQSQKPEGKWVKKSGVKYFQGYYTHNGEKIVPSWGGSLFEFLMPSLMVKEKELAPNGFGLNDLKGVNAHIAMAKMKGYNAWGFSPCSTPDGSYGGYTEFGVAGIGFKGYKDEGVVTPHVVFLSLTFAPEEAISDIRRLLYYYNIYGEFGMYDAVNVKNGRVSYKYLALDQGMILPSIDNYLNNGAIRERFHKDPVARKTEKLLNENFFE
ncbi:MAG: glucoamylase family protein [Candidatus Omnitrophica bacterium]|nr:glucoamylase family protein [Candidatus Omnitrophota bacterium]